MKKILHSILSITTISFLSVSTLSAQGWWYRKSDVNLSARTAAVGFTIGSGGFIGTGFDSSSYRRNFSGYNPGVDSWSSTQSIGGSAGSGLSRDAASAFVIGNKAYIVTGQGSNPFLNDTWEYDAVSDSWMQKANFGGTARRAAVGFAANNKGYVVCGQDATGLKNDLWMYDPATNVWTPKAAFPGTPRRLPVAFVISNVAYVGTGDDGAFKNDFYKYNAAANTWSAIASFAGTPRYGATAFALNTDGYVGTGYDNTLSNRKDFWKYNSVANVWVSVMDFKGSARSNAVAFSIGGYGYVGTGYDSLPTKDVWRYDPLSNGIDEIEKLRSSVKLYPNPMQTLTTLEFDHSSLNAFSKISFILYDINGREIKHIEEVTTSTLSINRENMNSGMYFYKLIADDRMIAAGKLVVN